MEVGYLPTSREPTLHSSPTPQRIYQIHSAVENDLPKNRSLLPTTNHSQLPVDPNTAVQ